MFQIKPFTSFKPSVGLFFVGFLLGSLPAFSRLVEARCAGAGLRYSRLCLCQLLPILHCGQHFLILQINTDRPRVSNSQHFFRLFAQPSVTYVFWHDGQWNKPMQPIIIQATGSVILVAVATTHFAYAYNAHQFVLLVSPDTASSVLNLRFYTSEGRFLPQTTGFASLRLTLFCCPLWH